MDYSEELIEKYDAQTVVAVLLKLFQGEAMIPDTYTVLQQSEFRGVRYGRRENRRKGSARRKNRHKWDRGKSQKAKARKKDDLKQKDIKRRKKKGTRKDIVSM